MLSFFLPNISLRLLWGDLIAPPQKVIPDLFMAISLAHNISWFFICSLGLLLKWTGCQVPEMFIGIALNSPGNPSISIAISSSRRAQGTCEKGCPGGQGEELSHSCWGAILPPSMTSISRVNVPYRCGTWCISLFPHGLRK